MKKILFSLFLTVSFSCFAQSYVVKDDLQQEDLDAIYKVYDMQIFHDSFLVKEFIEQMRNNEMLALSDDSEYDVGDGYEIYFDQKDSNILKKQITQGVKNKNLMRISWKEQQEDIQKNPYKAFTTIIENYNIKKLTNKDIDALNTVDKNAIFRVLDLQGEAGPDIGASAVPVVYDE